MKPILRPAIRLQLGFVLGVLIVIVPTLLVAMKLPVLRDWSPWVFVGIAVVIVAVLLVWLRQDISPDGTSVKPKWW